MRRWAFNVAAVVSLLLCVGTVALWVRSYRAGDNLNWFYSTGPAGNGPPGNRAGTRGLCLSEPGRLTLLISPSVNHAIKLGDDGEPRWVVTPEGFRFGTGDAFTITNISLGPSPYELALGPVHYASGHGMYLRVSDWLSALGLAVLPALWLILFVRKHRRRTSRLCLVCGYDLRATPGRCPECGTPTTAGVKA